MKSLFRVLSLTLLLLMGVGQSSATHVMGTDMTYEQVSAGRYVIKLSVYRDCSGITVGNSAMVAKSATKTINMGANQLISITDITPVGLNCGITSRCASSSYPYGVQKYYFVDTLDLSAEAECDWRISWEQCCRNSIINTGSSGEYFYNLLTLNKCVSNSSPEYTIPPVVFLLQNEDVALNMGALDSTDGFDSLSFHLVPGLQSFGNNITYGGNFSPTRPLTFLGFPNENRAYPGGFHIIPQTGDLLFRPTLVNQVAIIVMEVNEYKKINGTMTIIGTTRRDIQIIILPPNNSSSPEITNFHQPVQYVCLGDTLDFDILTSDSNASDTTTIKWNNGIFPAQFTANNGQSKHASAHFYWVPTSQDVREGPYSFTATVTDNSCPLNRSVSRTYHIYVRDSVPAPEVQVGADYSDSVNTDSLFVTSTIQNQYFRLATWKSSGDGYFLDSFSANTVYVPGAQDKASCSYFLYRGIWNQDHCFSGGKWSDTMEVKKAVSAPEAGLNQELFYGDTLFLEGNWANSLGQQAFWSSNGDGYFVDTLNQTTYYVPGPSDWTSCSWDISLQTFGTNCDYYVDSLIAKRKMGVLNAGLDLSVLHGDTLLLQGEGDTLFPQTLQWRTLGDGVFSDSSDLLSTYVPGAQDLANCGTYLILGEVPISNCYSNSDSIQYTKALPIFEAGSNVQAYYGDSVSLNAEPAASASYQYGYWSTQGDGFFVDSNAASTVYFPGANDWANCGTTLYWNEIDQNCGGRIDSLRVLRVTTTVNAGTDQNSYFQSGLTYTLSGLTDTANGQTGFWTSNGDGTFNDSFDLNAVYTPGAGDLQNCEVVLTLTGFPAGTCTVFDEVEITIEDSAVQILSYAVDSMVFDTVYLSVYALPARANLSWTSNGTGSFITTQVNGAVYVLSQSDKLETNLTLAVENSAPCLVSNDQVVLNPALVLSTGNLVFGNMLKIYPNPASDELTIETNADWLPKKIKVFDMTGREVLSAQWTNEEIQRINLNTLTTGVYMIEVSDAQGNRSVSKITKN